ncbi:copper-translocating P-type ATPase [Bombilactobacillus thymidiniphilus]|uniref:P-type Cu(+) transporter n=1 Tax=Bombilactobacillus thymidiniphilus TaxID=2923363 RepID=A0ABY4PBX6_9LACO|nr:copper-translocating P-type ATPase [Bombilactobacillus thymidiniphilus]UQS83270.1 cadmium-translocating P-type ATPase [Bombilactobacillus thymidiniphilus]
MKMNDMDMNMDMGHHQHEMGGGDMMMHGGHMMHMGNLKQKFWVSLILALPILFLSPAMGVWLPFQFSFPGAHWVVIIFATILFFYGGRPFFNSAYYEVKDHKPAMMTLITLGITTSYLYSLYAFVSNTFFPNRPHVTDFFWELATLILIMLLGHWVEMNSMMKASSSLHDLASLLPAMVHVKNGDNFKDEALDQVQKGSTVMVKAGEAIPLDGTVISGTSDVNEALVTGESSAVTKEKGSSVIGGSLNNSQTLVVKVSQPATSGFLANVNNLVETSKENKSKLQTLADRVSGWLFYAAVLVGLLALIIWSIVTNFATGLERMVAVLVIACPHALGLAIPLVNARSTSLGSKNGLLVRNRQVIDISEHIDYVVLDKTGTLTQGNFKVEEYHTFNAKISDEEILQLTASLEQQSDHPIAKSITKLAKTKQITLKPATAVQTLAGQGIKGKIGDVEYQVVNEKSLAKQEIFVPKLANNAATISYLVKNNTVIGYLTVGDQIKAEAPELIKQLKKQNITPLMLTGDNQAAAKAVAEKLGISEFKAELLPQDKQKIIKQLQQQGHKVMMVGDGINDAPSLAQANIGVAIGAGTDIALDSADVILVNSNPIDIIKFFNLANNTHKKTVENLWWGAGYNIIAIPLAAGILAFAGIILSPAVGAIFMSLSTVVVSINASLLKL